MNVHIRKSKMGATGAIVTAMTASQAPTGALGLGALIKCILVTILPYDVAAVTSPPIPHATSAFGGAVSPPFFTARWHCT